jgi:DNA-binding XRE family transcriptional regulator
MESMLTMLLASTRMAKRPKIYLRTFRRRAGLTQLELAFLIGIKNATVISRIEGLKRPPRLEWAVALAALFGTRAGELFPGLFSQAHDDLLCRTRELYEELQGDLSKITRLNWTFLKK